MEYLILRKQLRSLYDSFEPEKWKDSVSRKGDGAEMEGETPAKKDAEENDALVCEQLTIGRIE